MKTLFGKIALFGEIIFLFLPKPQLHQWILIPIALLLALITNSLILWLIVLILLVLGVVTSLRCPRTNEHIVTIKGFKSTKGV